jgi:hypothetical protein
MSENEGLSPRQQVFLNCLLGEPTIRKAAAMAGISEATATRFRADPAFQRAYALARREQVDTTRTWPVHRVAPARPL